MEAFEGDWMKVTVDSNLQQTIVLDNRQNAVWNATRDIMLTYSVPYYKPQPPSAAAVVGDGQEAPAAEIPPWMRTRGGGDMNGGKGMGILRGAWRALMTRSGSACGGRARKE